MKVKSYLKTAGSVSATGASAVVTTTGVKALTMAEDTKSKVFATAQILVGAAGTVYAGLQTFQNAKELTAGIKKLSKNSPEAVAQNIQ